MNNEISGGVKKLNILYFGKIGKSDCLKMLFILSKLDCCNVKKKW